MVNKNSALVGGVLLFALVNSLATSIGVFVNTEIEKLPIHTKNKFLIRMIYIVINLAIILFLVNFVFKNVKVGELL